MMALVERTARLSAALSQHVGGMVMTRGPAVRAGADRKRRPCPSRTVIQWDKDDLDELGILKVDCLALGMLTAIRKCFDLVEQHHGRQLTLANVPEEDAGGVRHGLPGRHDGRVSDRKPGPDEHAAPAAAALVLRPGDRGGASCAPGRSRETWCILICGAARATETVTYPNDAIREVLEKTLGVPIFQEQAMRLAVVAAGFTPGEADQLRRAMGAWRRPGVMDQFRQKLIDGMLANGLSAEFAEQVFQQIRGFGEYGFPESHAASFALLVYVSAWLKCYYPAAFAAALVNSQPMGFYAPAQLVRDAREHGVEVRPRRCELQRLGLHAGGEPSRSRVMMLQLLSRPWQCD